jgi:hypothetical protein
MPTLKATYRKSLRTVVFKVTSVISRDIVTFAFKWATNEDRKVLIQNYILNSNQKIQI